MSYWNNDTLIGISSSFNQYLPKSLIVRCSADTLTSIQTVKSRRDLTCSCTAVEDCTQ